MAVLSPYYFLFRKTGVDLLETWIRFKPPVRLWAFEGGCAGSKYGFRGKWSVALLMCSFLWLMNSAGLKHHDNQSHYCRSFLSLSQLWGQEMESFDISLSLIIEPMTDSTFKTSPIGHGCFLATMPVQVTSHSPESYLWLRWLFLFLGPSSFGSHYSDFSPPSLPWPPALK